MRLKLLFLGIAIFLGIILLNIKNNTAINQQLVQVQPTPTIIPSNPGLSEPVENFKKRVTKKPFGIYVTPQNSPIKPERFTGYHTGTDAEYEDISSEVSVKAIDKGRVVFSGYVNGYGGVVVIHHQIKNQDILALYGHLKPASLISKNSTVSAGQKIGILGKGDSSETNGERKHLHLSLIKGTKIDFRGYVQNSNELKNWINPLDLFN